MQRLLRRPRLAFIRLLEGKLRSVLTSRASINEYRYGASPQDALNNLLNWGSSSKDGAIKKQQQLVFSDFNLNEVQPILNTLNYQKIVDKRCLINP